MARLGDDEAPAHADEAHRLPQDRLEPTRVLLGAGELDRLGGGLELVEPHHAALGLGDHLLRHDHDVAVLEPDPLRDERRHVVALAHLRDPLDGEDLDARHGMPVTRMPAWAL